MAAQILVASFLGCLFALTAIVLVGFQIAGWMFRRWIKTGLPGLIQKALHGELGAETTKHAEQLTRMVNDLNDGVVRCGKCGLTVHVKPEDYAHLEPTLTALGWEFNAEKFDGYGCSACSAGIDMTGGDISGTPPQ